MRSYVVLLNWTDQCAKNSRDTIRRAEAFCRLIESRGSKVREHLFTLGEYDIVMVTESPTMTPQQPPCSRSPRSATSAPIPYGPSRRGNGGDHCQPRLGVTPVTWLTSPGVVRRLASRTGMMDSWQGLPQEPEVTG
jgi:GYD domain